MEQLARVQQSTDIGRLVYQWPSGGQDEGGKTYRTLEIGGRSHGKRALAQAGVMSVSWIVFRFRRLFVSATHVP
ncbi:MAG: hypothetical protein KBH81_13480 [Phycisphaerae bacterium]|nr:hypothetical protein [Phycisphaerae bacterium]HRS26723.1 hypothetical protein [Phycisphaerae bacterium]HRT40741.1 hypothetical protein [Phycisphaerae bacterium]